MFKYKPWSNPNGKPSFKRKLIVNQTKSELFFYDAYIRLRQKGIGKCVAQKISRINGKRIFIDFYFPSRKLAIELDGGYHILQKEKDQQRDKLLWEQRKILTLRIKNEDLNDKYMEKLLIFINKLLYIINPKKNIKEIKINQQLLKNFVTSL